VRIRLDPIVPFEGRREAYSETIKQIFSKICPERVTLGTLRFEESFYNMRNTIVTSGPDLPNFIEEMEPMFSPKRFTGLKKPKCGKYGFTENKRSEIFGFARNEIRKYSDCHIALCKESASIWKNWECHYQDAVVSTSWITQTCHKNNFMPYLQGTKSPQFLGPGTVSSPQ
jgi:spore photoproduct lyase